MQGRYYAERIIVNVPIRTLADAALLRSAVSTLARRLRTQHPADDMGTTEMVILGRLLRVGSSGAAELARGEGLQPQSITRALRSLEDRGLVRRGTDDADRRRAVIEITAKGEARLRAALFGRITWLSRALEGRFTPEERATLRAAAKLMQRLAETNEE